MIVSESTYPSQPPTTGLPPTSPPLATDALAIASLIIGSIALLTGCCCFCIGLPAGAVAVVLGAVALVRIRRNAPQRSGRELAIAGIVCGCLALLLGVAMLMLGWTVSWMDSAKMAFDDLPTSWLRRW